MRQGEVYWLRFTGEGAEREVVTVDRARLAERVGTLGTARLREVLGGLALLSGIEPDEP
jgi:mRNA-degrading endonuclease toxin of MazEF toxin-antitoxin module